MDVMQRAERIAELLKTKQEAETEINSLINGEAPKRKWTRKSSEQELPALSTN